MSFDNPHAALVLHRDRGEELTRALARHRRPAEPIVPTPRRRSRWALPTRLPVTARLS
ncbi:hypothetical protein [Cellulomonas sp. P5_C6]